jgi:hypothetical protein
MGPLQRIHNAAAMGCGQTMKQNFRTADYKKSAVYEGWSIFIIAEMKDYEFFTRVHDT